MRNSLPNVAVHIVPRGTFDYAQHEGLSEIRDAPLLDMLLPELDCSVATGAMSPTNWVMLK